MYTLSHLYLYPIKSLAGISLTTARVERRGLQYDRRWMLIDDDGRFVSQREFSEMALLGTAIEPPHLVVFHRNHPEQRLHIPLEPPLDTVEEIPVQIWDDTCPARLLPAETGQWFSDVLGSPLRLVYMPDTTYRMADTNYAPEGHAVSFADGYPFLLIGQASLDDLNRRLDQPLPINRFRPNFVFTGGTPYEEDQWRDFSIGQVPFRGVKPCGRCIIPTTDQDTGQRAAEPLKTLSTYRKSGNKILFGQNVVWMGNDAAAEVRVGDILRRHENSDLHSE